MPTPPRKKPSSAADFKKKAGPTELPSGNFMVLRKVSMAVMIQTGQIPNGLMSVVESSLNSKKKKDDEEIAAELIGTPEKLNELLASVDKYVCMVALEPEVLPIPRNEDDRQDDLLYVDEMDLEDKMFIFQLGVSGGSTDLSQFRKEFGSGLGSL